MLARLWRRTEQDADAVPKLVSVTASQGSWPTLVPITDAPNPAPRSVAANGNRKRRPKPIRVRSLYLEPPSEHLRHARALLQLVQTWSPEMIGEYIWQSDLERTYHELCQKEQWEPHHWTPIGKELGKLTDRIIRRDRRRGGKKYRAYKIPKCAPRVHRQKSQIVAD